MAKLFRIIFSLVLGNLIIIILLFFFYYGMPLYRSLGDAKWVTQEVATHLHQPIRIGQISFSWQDFEPTLQLDNLSLLNKDGSPALPVKKLKVGINLIASFLRWKIIPGNIYVEGANFNFNEIYPGAYSINNIPNLTIDINAQDLVKLNYLIDSFLTSGHKQLKDVTINVNDKEGLNLLALNNINLQAEGNFLVHQFQGNAAIQNQPYLVVDGKVYGSYLCHKLLYLKTHLKTQNLAIGKINLLKRLIPTFNLESTQVALDMDLILNRRVVRLDGKALANHLLYHYPGNPPSSFDHLMTDFNFNQGLEETKLTLDHLQVISKGLLLPTHKVTFRQKRGMPSSQLDVGVDVLPIKDTVQFAVGNKLVPQTYVDALNGFKPSGNIHNFSLHRVASKNNFTIRGNLKNINLQPYHNYPGMKNITGELSISPHNGNLRVHSSDVVVEYFPMFKDRMFINSLKGQIKWSRDSSGNWMIKLNKIDLKNQDGSLNGFMNIIIPSASNNPYIQSKFSFKLSDLKHAFIYCPVSIMPINVLAWLEGAIKNGSINNGLFILNGHRDDFPFDHEKGKFLISAELTNGALNYLKSWPEVKNIDAHLLFEGRKMIITSRQAETKGIKIQSLVARIDNLEKSLLSLQAKLATLPTQTVLFQKEDNPLLNFIKYPSLANLKIDGQWNLGLNLQLPLDHRFKNPAKFKGQLDLNQVAITANHANISLDNLRGSLQFADDSLQSQTVTGNLFSKPFSLTVSNNQTTQGKLTQAVLNSRIQISDLQKMSNHHLLEKLQGETKYRANLSILKQLNGDLKTMLTVASNLVGIEANLPPPLGKQKMLAIPSRFQIESRYSPETVPKGQVRLMRFQYGPMLNGILSFKQDQDQFHFDRGQIQFSHQTAILPQNRGLSIQGSIPVIDLAWKSLLLDDRSKTNSLPEQLKNVRNLVNEIDLKSGKLKLGDFSFSDAKIKTHASADGMLLFLGSNEIQGQIEFPKNYPNVPIKIDLQKLIINKNKSLNTDLSPKDIPSLDLSITNFLYQQKQIKNIDLQLRPKQHDILIKRFSIKEPFFDLNATGVWHEVNGRSFTQLNGQFFTKNLGAMLNHWQFTNNIVQGNGNAEFSIAWSDTPFNLAASNLTGSMNLHFNHGRIIKLSQRANLSMGMGKVLTLLSLENLQRRLKLDFSDLTETGFSFDEMTGQLEFRGGNISTSNGSLSGPVANVSIKGRIGAITKDYNLGLIVYPKVTSSLPVVATLTAGPIVGAATWLVNKVFSNQVKQITGIHYHVTGSWDNPTVSETAN